MYIPLHHIVIRDARRPRVAKEFSRIDESLREFIGEQAMFLVANAPPRKVGESTSPPRDIAIRSR